MTATLATEAERPGLASSSFRRLSRDSAIFASGAVAGKLIGLLLLPLLTRQLSQAEYGRLDVLSTLASSLVSALTLGLDVALARLVPEMGGKRRPLFGTYVAMSLAGAGAAAVVLALVAAPATQALFGPEGRTVDLLVVAGLAIAGLAQVAVLNVYRTSGRPGRYAVASAGALVVHALLAVWLVVSWQAAATSILVAWLATQALFAAAGLVLVRRDLARPARPMAVALLRLGLPAAPAILFTYGAEFANRAVLLGAAGETEVAHLSVALRFASLAGLIVTGFQLAWQPRAYDLFARAGGHAILQREARRIVGVVGVVALSIGALAPEAVGLVAGPAYVAAAPAVALAAAGIALGSLYMVGATSSVIRRRTRELALATGAGLGLSIAINTWAAPLGGATATAAAIAVGQLAAAGLLLGRDRRAGQGLGSTRLVAACLVAVAGLAVLAVTNADLPTRLLVGLIGAGAVWVVAESRVGPR